MIQNKIKGDDLNDCTKIQLGILSEKRKGGKKIEVCEACHYQFVDD